jgi:hypothetical protein
VVVFSCSFEDVVVVLKRSNLDHSNQSVDSRVQSGKRLSSTRSAHCMYIKAAQANEDNDDIGMATENVNNNLALVR